MAIDSLKAMATDPPKSLASAAPLIVYIDYKSPYAYLAVEPTHALAEELGIEVDWRPFTLDIPSYLGSARLSHEGKVVENDRTPGQWTKVKYAYHDVRRYGALRGLIIRGATRMWDSSLTGIGMLWAKAQGAAALRAYSALVYERFWKRELDPEVVEVIERVLREAGARTAGFREYAQGEGRALHDCLQREAFEAGIFGVPTYVIDGEVFFGREHLPRIRWMLAGRAGAAPDIAYPTVPGQLAAASKPGERRLTVAIDFKSPQAYLAIGPTCAMADELGIKIDWRPLVMTPSKAAASRPAGDDRGARHRRIRADYLAQDVARYAADRDLAIEGFERRQDSTVASLGLLWAQRQSPPRAREYVEQVFVRYGKAALALDDARAIQALLIELGAPAAEFAAFLEGAGRLELAGVQAELRDRGVFEVPTYLMNDDTYLGRQHLPLLRRYLTNASPAA